MYRKYKSMHRDVQKFLECSRCFGHPLFASEKSFLIHQQECHGDAFKMATRITDNDFLSNKHHQSIDMLSEKVRSQDDSICEVKEQLQFLIGDILNHRDYNTEVNQEPVIGLRRRQSKVSVLNENSIRLKEEQLKLTEELRLLNIQQQKQNEHHNIWIQDQQLKDITTNNFNSIFKQFNTLESKIDSKVCVDQNTKQQVHLLLQKKDEQIQVFKDENILLSQNYAQLKATIIILQNELKDNHPRTPVSTESLEELSYKAKKLKGVNEIWMEGSNCKQKDIAQQKSLVKHFKGLLGEKEKLLDHLQTKLDKNDEKIKILSSENSSLKEKVIMLSKDVEEKENHLIISIANIKTCKDEAETAEKQLLEGCIEQLKQQYNVENKLKENKITEISAKLCNIEKSYSKANDVIAQLQNEKAEMLLNLEGKESLYRKEKESYENIIKGVGLKYDEEKRALIEQAKLQCESKATERLTYLQEELALKNNNIISKDKDLKMMNDECEIVNEELFQMKCTLESSTNEVSNLKMKATEYSELLKQEKKISEKLKQEHKEQLIALKIRAKGLADEKEDIEFKVNELEVALEEVTESRDLLEFEKDEIAEKNKLQRKTLNSFIDNSARQHNKMNNLINENNYFYERYSTHMTFKKHVDFDRNQANQKLKESNAENERMTRENKDLQEKLQSCMKELSEVKLLTKIYSISNHNDEKVTSKTISMKAESSSNRADDIQVKPKSKFNVSDDLHIDEFIANLDDILHSEEKPALLQHSYNEATNKKNDQLTEDITVSDFHLSQCDYYEDVEQAEIAPSTSNDVSFEFEEELEDLPQDNVKVIAEVGAITDLHTDWDAMTEEKSKKEKKEKMFDTAADDVIDMLNESVSNISSRDESVEPVANTADITNNKLAEPVPSTTDTTNNKLAEPVDNSFNSSDSMMSVTEENHLDESVTVSHISSRDYDYGELAEPAVSTTDTTNSKLAEPADKSLTEENYLDESITVSHISSRDYDYGELAEPAVSTTDTTNNKLAEPADKSLTEENYLDESFDATVKDASVASKSSSSADLTNNTDDANSVHLSNNTDDANSVRLTNNNDACNSEVVVCSDNDEDYSNESFDEDYSNESFEEEEESREQSVSDVTSANDSQSQLRDHDSSEINFHATNLMHDEEDVCDESVEEEICEEIDNTSDDIYADGADSLSNEYFMKFDENKISLDSTMVVKKTKNFCRNLLSLNQSPSVLIPTRNDVTTDEDDISFADVDIDDLLNDMELVVNQKQHQPNKNKNFF